MSPFFGVAMSREEARDRLHADFERESGLGMQYWLFIFRGTGGFGGFAGIRPWSIDPETIEGGVNLMRSARGLRLREEALPAVLAHGFETLGLPVIVAAHGVAHDNLPKLLEQVGFKYTHDILWSLKKIEVCMWSDCGELARQESATITAAHAS